MLVQLCKQLLGLMFDSGKIDNATSVNGAFRRSGLECLHGTSEPLAKVMDSGKEVAMFPL